MGKMASDDSWFSRRAHHRKEVRSLLLEHTLRALRLSIVVVGETTEIEDIEVPAHGTDISTETKTMTGIDLTSAPGAGCNRAPHSVNANAHVGGISVDCRGHIILPATCQTRNKSTGKKVDGVEHHESADQGDSDSYKKDDARVLSSTEDAQRAVIGAWLLAKEACRCLSTMVTAFPLPVSLPTATEIQVTGTEPQLARATITNRSELGATVTTQRMEGSTRTQDATTVETISARPSVDVGLAGASKLPGQEYSINANGVTREVVDLGFDGWVSGVEDVRLVGEALLESLLALKHMGCVASAQVIMIGTSMWRN